MKHLLLRYQRELTVFAAVLIATGGFAIAALVSEGSQAVGAGTYVVRSDTSGLLVTGEVLERHDERARPDRDGREVADAARQDADADAPCGARRPRARDCHGDGLAVPASGLASPALTVTESETLTVRQVETRLRDADCGRLPQTVTETVVVTETLPATTATVEAPPSSE